MNISLRKSGNYSRGSTFQEYMIRIVTGLILGIFGAIAILPSGCARSPKSNLEPIQIVGSTWYGHVPVLHAIESGILERAGFAPVYREVVKSADRIAALASGRVQFGSVGQIAMLSALSHGNDSFYWVGTQDMAIGFEGLVAGGGISTFHELRGKKVGVPFATSADLTARLLLGMHGVRDEEVQYINMDPASIPAAMESGDLDAAAVWEPYLGRLRQIPGANLLGMDTETEVYSRFGTMSGLDVLLLNRRWVDEDPQRAQRFMSAYWNAVAYVKSDPIAALAGIHEKYFFEDLEALEEQLGKFSWLDHGDQASHMSESKIFAQSDFVCRVLRDRLGYIEVIPDFRSVIPSGFIPEQEADF